VINKKTDVVLSYDFKKCYLITTAFAEYFITTSFYFCRFAQSSGLAARKRQERMTIWASWTRRCYSCTSWITAAMAPPRTKSKGVSRHAFASLAKFQLVQFLSFFPPALQGQTHASCD
jgi:hypothetical protein